MQYWLLGCTGGRVSPLVLGGDNFLNPTSESDSIRLIDQALDGGINMINTSNNYMRGESERVIGKACDGGADGQRGKRMKSAINCVPNPKIVIRQCPVQ